MAVRSCSVISPEGGGQSIRYIGARYDCEIERILG